MATIINTPPNTNSDNGLSTLLGIALVVLLAILFFMYGLPALSRMMRPSSPTIMVPDQIDVNVQGIDPGQ